MKEPKLVLFLFILIF